MNITTCLLEDAPKGSRLSFETSGKLRGTSIVAAQKGTTVSVEKLFHNLPVRRRELERNIKREWHKVIALLNQYACIQTNTKFTVSQQPTKGKRIVLFSTKGNPTTRDNIINIFGAKTMSALVPLNMKLEMQPSGLSSALQSTVDPGTISKEVRLVGYVSRPTHGDGRQTPDRQMFFINGRPCGLPQFAKTFNEVYKSYNSTQSPFIFADIQLDTHMYDVNVSPDKRTILLHDQNQLLDSIRTSLVDLFDSHDYTMPMSQLKRLKSSSSGQTTLSPLAETSQCKNSQLQSGFPVQESSIDNVSSLSSDPEVSQTQRSWGNPSQSETGLIKADKLDRWITKSDIHQHTSGDVASEGFAVTTPGDEELNNSDVSETPSNKPTSWETEDPASIVATDMKGAPAASSSQLTSLSEPKEDTTTIPTVQPVKAIKRGGDYLTQGSPAKRASGPASIIIGNPRPVSGLRDPQPHSSPRAVEDDREEDSEENDDDVERLEEDGEIEGDEDDEDDESSDGERPTFGAALSQRFAAGQDRSDSLQSPGGCHAKSVPSTSRTRGREEIYVPPKKGDFQFGEYAEFVDNQHSSRGSSAELDVRSGQDEISSSPCGGDLAVEHAIGETTVAKPRLQPLQGASRRKDVTLQFVQHLQIDESEVESRMSSCLDHVPSRVGDSSNRHEVEDITASDAESKLSLIISKSDFPGMRVAGQFNMGFIIAVRPRENRRQDPNASGGDELFIIDQHASDEKYNFERLQDTTVVQSQRLVHPKRLELTALEEEIVMQSMAAIEANGFKIEVDMDGEWPVGSRCQLTALPLSRETTFNVADLEELISLLGDESAESKHIPRPSKVRKMFAMRACRSSIMIGKALTQSQMYTLVGHMGELDKPWNCPHGRPTMRHLCRMQTWDEKGWAGDLDGGSLASWKSYGCNTY